MRVKEFTLGLKFSLSYFSILPIKFKSGDNLDDDRVLRWMILFFPLVGAILSLVIILFLSFSSNWLYTLFEATFYMVLYGFLHTEAIIDVVDALFAKHSNKSPYEVIKEPTVGAMGVLFGVAFLILKIATLTYLFLEQKGLFLVAVAVGSRVGAILVIWLFEFKSSFINRLKESLSKESLKVVFSIYLLLILLLLGVKYFAILIFSALVSILLAKIIKNSLGFANGDVVGAVVELVELISLILVVSIF